jgi:PAS domain S-box-containing protein
VHGTAEKADTEVMDYRIGADDLQELIALCDADGILLDWNKAAEEVTGFAKADIVGYHLDSIVAPDSRADLGSILSLGKAGTLLPGMPLRLQSSFGMEIPVEVTSLPREEAGRFVGWLLIFRDTTLKVQLQEQLDRMDQLYRGLVDCSPAIIYVLDADGRILFINDTAEVLLGYSKAELLGRELAEIVHPDDRQFAYWPVRERRRDPRATRNLELRLMTKIGVPRRYDLDYVHISLNAFGLRWRQPAGAGGASGAAGDTALGTQGIARDITELVLLRMFSREVQSILPICSVCRRIRVKVAAGESWVPLDEYVSLKSTVLFSHTFCPEHVPSLM